MSAAVSVPFVSIEEYLHTVYEPDVDYVDGVLEDRNVGEFDHSMVQRAILIALIAFEDEASAIAIQETRTQTQATRFRVPDICMVRTEDAEQIFRRPPLLCVEVLSPEDRLPRMRTKCQDYLNMGVPAVWIFDPQNELAYEMKNDFWREVREGVLRLSTSPVQLDIQKIFAEAKRRGRKS